MSDSLLRSARSVARSTTEAGVLTSQPIVVVCLTLGAVAPQPLHKPHTGRRPEVLKSVVEYMAVHIRWSASPRMVRNDTGGRQVRRRPKRIHDAISRSAFVSSVIEVCVSFATDEKRSVAAICEREVAVCLISSVGASAGVQITIGFVVEFTGKTDVVDHDW